MLVPVGQHKGNEPLTLSRPLTLIGSNASARLYLPSKAVSRCHAVIINTGAGLFVRDLASRTQTRINGQVVNEADLREGDVLQVGPFTFRFTDPTAPTVKPPTLPAPPAAFEVEGLDRPLRIEGRAVLIGRRETADISLTENAASSAHALVFVLEGRHVVRDLNSRTGTFVNGAKVHEQALEPGDLLRVGETQFRYLRLGAPVPVRDAAEAAAPAGSKAAPPADEAPAASGELDLVPSEVAPLIESEPAPSPALERSEPEHPSGNGGGPGLLEMDDSGAGSGGGSPSPEVATAADGDDGTGAPMRPLE